MIDVAFGIATLIDGENRYSARVKLDASNNYFHVSIYCRGHISIDSVVSLEDVEIFGDSVKWTTQSIDKLIIINTRCGGFAAGETPIGEITGQNQHRTTLTVTKNGQHNFDLDSKFERSFEFSGGISTCSEIELSDGIQFFSDGKRSSLRGKNCSDVNEELAALSLACGCVMRPRYELDGKNLTMIFWQPLNEIKGLPIFDAAKDGWKDHDKTSAGIKEVYLKVKQSLNVIPDGAKAPIKKLIFLFLHCRQMTNVLDIQMLSLFSFLEAIDGSRTLNGTTLASLLKINIDMAKELVEVRNKYSHGTHSLSEAIAEFVNLDRDEYKPFLVFQNAEHLPTASFMNLFHSRCNRVFLDMIGAQVDEARPYPK